MWVARWERQASYWRAQRERRRLRWRRFVTFISSLILPGLIASAGVFGFVQQTAGVQAMDTLADSAQTHFAVDPSAADPGSAPLDTAVGTVIPQVVPRCGESVERSGSTGYARVTNVGWPGLRVREGPGITFTTQAVIEEGTIVAALGPACADREGRRWQPVSVSASMRGWSAAEYLVPASADDAAAMRAGGSDVSTIHPVMLAKITAYTYQEPVGGAHGWITRSGVPVIWSMVAVDPNVIPLGSSVLIDGFDTVFRATDTGHGVRGLHVDIFFPDQDSAVQFGVQYREVTVLN